MEELHFQRKDKPDTLRSEHLKEGLKPIIGCIYDRNEMTKEDKLFFDNFKKNAKHINFGANEFDLNKNQMLNSGQDTYIISPCDSKNKYDDKYQGCTSVIVSGVEKETGKNISIMTHQYPGWFLNKTNNNIEIKKFKSDLATRINELKNRCINGSIDAIVLGGNKEDVIDGNLSEEYKSGYDDEDEYFREPYDIYVRSIKTINLVVNEVLGFSPVVMSGPNDNLDTKNNPLDLYYDNENKRIYIIKPKQNNYKNNESFIALNVEKHIDRIKNNDEK